MGLGPNSHLLLGERNAAPYWVVKWPLFLIDFPIRIDEKSSTIFGFLRE